MRRAAAIVTVALTLISALFFLATAVYALLVYVPFSYQQFILPHVVPGLATFAAWHPVLSRVQSDGWSLAVCVLSLVPILLLAARDVMTAPGRIVWGEADPGEERRVFTAALLTAVFVSVVYAAIAVAATGAPAAAPMRTLLVALVWSVASHLALFGALFLALVAGRGVVRLAGGDPVHEAGAILVFAATLGAGVIARIVFPAISFTGPVASGVAVALALSLAALLGGVVIRLRRLSSEPTRSGLELLTSPLAFLGRPRRAGWPGVVALVAIGGAAWILARGASMLDWNHLLQKLSAIAIWVVAFSALYAMRGGGGRAVAGVAVVWLLMGAAVPAVSYRALGAIQARVPGWLGLPHLDVDGVLEAHAGVDPSFKVIHDAVRAVAARDDRWFYDLLERNTNIARAVRIDPVEVNLVDALVARTGRVPHIFVFVIDSLRQDYLSPYNTGVTFTPAIDAFARDSVVFPRAFTRYGATGLSEPSIWVGGLLVHKQYVMPFAPMNALQKLLAVNGYERMISRDTILRTIMPAGAADVDLDAGVANMDYDLCRSLGEVRTRIRGRSGAQPPVFVYTQPQNIHISRLTRDGATVPAGAAYPGFYAPYAARVERMDACFGEFLQFLRDQDLFDDSLIVLTSDHGDSLGEGGRWGHAYTIFPEIVRVPLIVHLPRALRSATTCDTEAVATLVDITPTLYYLLGHRPLAGGAILGRSLCTATPAERIATRRDSYMIASSYGPVYGILRDNGRWLYIGDGVNYTDYLYDLSAGAAAPATAVTPGTRRQYQQLISEGIAEVNAFYVPPAAGR